MGGAGTCRICITVPINTALDVQAAAHAGSGGAHVQAKAWPTANASNAKRFPIPFMPRRRLFRREARIFAHLPRLPQVPAFVRGQERKARAQSHLERAYKRRR